MYHTMTPAEAKRLTKYMSLRLPTRTASVLSKPRPPPIVITDPDTFSHELPSLTKHQESQLYASQQRSSSACSDSPSFPKHRHSINLGQITQRYPQQNLNTSQRLSDDSFASAKSHQSDTSKVKSLSKSSLSSSTSKVFQNQLCNIKKFFRNMPTRRSVALRNSQSKSIDKMSSDKLAESISQICLNRSQSPPVCPPPPGELKSVSYLESSVNYSNYDEFTRARNQITSTLLRQATNGPPTRDCNGIGAHRDSQTKTPLIEHNERDSWQLTSLPVTYERNLATVFEEKNNSIDTTRRASKGDHFISSYNNNLEYSNNERSVDRKHMIKPPSDFDDTCFESTRLDASFKTATEFGSNHSLTSVITADSVLDYRQTAATFRFSYTQPDPPRQVNSSNSGLPPRMPLGSDGSEQFTSNGSPKSSCSSSVIDGTTNRNSNNCDSKEASACDTVDHYNSISVESNAITSPCIGNEAETSILSDTSTLNGEYFHTTTANRCTELERTVNILKIKLNDKEKELTDLQLKQWSSDYHIEQLRSKISQLEKENAQLKMIFNRNQTFNRVNI